MTLYIKRDADGSGEVGNTDTTEVSIANGYVRIGGTLKNTGKVRILSGGMLDVDKDLFNEGDFCIGDSQQMKEIILESLKVGRSVADFGTEFLKRLNLLK